MPKLGVSVSFTRERNLQIIEEHWLKDPKLTRSQVNFLRHFPSFTHHKDDPTCDCLGCAGVKLINELEKKL